MVNECSRNSQNLQKSPLSVEEYMALLEKFESMENKLKNTKETIEGIISEVCVSDNKQYETLITEKNNVLKDLTTVIEVSTKYRRRLSESVDELMEISHSKLKVEI